VIYKLNFYFHGDWRVCKIERTFRKNMRFPSKDKTSEKVKRISYKILHAYMKKSGAKCFSEKSVHSNGLHGVVSREI
jgi:hypothetical protein